MSGLVQHKSEHRESKKLFGRGAGFWLLCPAMDDLIKLVRTYRLTAGVADRLRLAEDIFRRIEPDLRLFVFSAVHPDFAEDISQETLKAVATGLKKFRGDSNEQFWGWAYCIARNKLNDHFRAKTANREDTMTRDELWELVESSGQLSPLSPADRHDLEYALQLLTNSKPECRDYLWQHFVFGMDYREIAEEKNLSYDNVRMKIRRCLDEAKSLVS